MKIGIDLGTTRSAASIVEAGDPTLLMNDRGDRLTPSIVFYDDDGVHVGKKATSKADAGETIREIKRKMGSDEVAECNGNEYDPVTVSGAIIEQLVDQSETYLDEPVDGVIITVPAYFTADQKRDTREAAIQAGFDKDDVELLYEPTAAAIAHGFNNDLDETLLVYDFGGGTLDISILEVSGNKFSMLATAGDADLGGVDFTEAIVDLLADEYEDDHGVDIRESPEAYENLRQAAEERKKELSGSDQTTVNEPLLGQIDGEVVGIRERVLTRNEFNDVTSDLITRAESPIDEALDKAGLEETDVDNILLVGGSSKLQSVQDMIAQKFGTDPTTSADLDRIVAKGAAIVAKGEAEGETDYKCPSCGTRFDEIVEMFSHIANEHGVDTCPFPSCDAAVADANALADHLSDKHGTELTETAGTGGDGGDDEGGSKTGIEKEGIVTRSLGTDVKGGRMDIIIPNGETRPAENTRRYTTTRDGQTRVPVHVYQGENEDDRDANVQLDTWYLEGLPEMDAREPTINVTFRIDKDGIVEVSAEEETSGTVDTTRVSTEGQSLLSGDGASGEDKQNADD
jgi:molecular chaperone DnaK (HSP70)